jgi:enamine deaminase RidA (YjgF/YER057c/UK114 family)
VNRNGRLDFFRNALSLAAIASLLPRRASAQTLGKQYIKTAHAQDSAYSQAVVAAPGRTIYLAGTAGGSDDTGKPIEDFEGQVRQLFHTFSVTLGQAGGKLSDIVTMTVVLKDFKYAKEFVDIRKQLFGDNFPASTIVNGTVLASPQTLISIQGVAVVNS